MRIYLVLMGLLIAAPGHAFASPAIFACEPEWAALAKEIATQDTKIVSATHAKQDPHHIRARPSLIAKIRKADMLLCSGGGLEAGWLPLLLQKASSRVQPGNTGYIMAAEHVAVLGIPKTLDRSMGDVHPEGNPHVHLNPHNITILAKLLAGRLKQIDPDNAAQYQKNYTQFITKWRQAITRWEQEARGLKNKRVIVHHKSFTYLLDWLGMQAVASLEPKPGLPPSSKHLETLLHIAADKKPSAIIRSVYDADEASRWLSEQSGVKAIELPYTVGGDEHSDDLFALFDRTLLLLKGAAHD